LETQLHVYILLHLFQPVPFIHDDCQLCKGVTQCCTVCKYTYWLLTSCLCWCCSFNLLYCVTALPSVFFFFFHFTLFRKKLHWMSSIKENCLANKNTQYIYIYIFFIFDSIFDNVLSLFYICVLDYAFTSWHRVLHMHTYTHSCVYWRIKFCKPIQVFWCRQCC